MKILRVNLTGTKKAMKKIVIAIALCVLVSGFMHQGRGEEQGV